MPSGPMALSGSNPKVGSELTAVELLLFVLFEAFFSTFFTSDTCKDVNDHTSDMCYKCWQAENNIIRHLCNQASTSKISSHENEARNSLSDYDNYDKHCDMPLENNTNKGTKKTLSNDKIVMVLMNTARIYPYIKGYRNVDNISIKLNKNPN